MHDPRRVRSRQAVRHLPPQRQHFLHRACPLRQDLAQAPPLDQLHGDVEPAVLLVDVVDGDDVGVVQGGGGAGFPLEPPAAQLQQRRRECGIPFWPHGFVTAHCDMDELLKHWTSEYACLGYGTDLQPALADFCEMTGIEAVIP